MLHSYRPLMRFWAAVLLFCGSGVVALEALGPPPSGALVSVPVPPVQEVAKAPVAPAEVAPAAVAEAPAARAVAPVLPAPVLPAAATAAVAGVPLSPPVPAQPGPRKAAPPKATTAQRGTLPDDATGPRYGAADRRAPTRDIWGNPLLPPAGGWADRPPPAAGRGEGGYIGVFTVGPDGTRSFRAGP